MVRESQKSSLVQLVSFQAKVFFHAGYVGIADVGLIKIFTRTISMRACEASVSLTLDNLEYVSMVPEFALQLQCRHTLRNAAKCH